MLTQTILAVFLLGGQFELGSPQLDAPAAFPVNSPEAQLPTGPDRRAPAAAEGADLETIRRIGGDSLAAVEPDAIDSTVALLRDALQRECRRPLGGRSVLLASALAASAQRSATAQAYWRLAGTTAAYHFCVEETDFLFSLADPPAAHQRAILAALQAGAKADEVRARLDALRAQHVLAATQPTAGEPPLTADLPFVGVYETHYGKLQARGQVSEQLSQIHQTLPTLQELLRRQADAVFASGAALGELRQAYEAGGVALAEVLESFRHLRHQRREFLASVLEYNDAIARYAFAVASPALPVSQVVGMLIEDAGGEPMERSVLAARRQGNSIRRVSNDEPIPIAEEGWSGRE